MKQVNRICAEDFDDLHYSMTHNMARDLYAVDQQRQLISGARLSDLDMMEKSLDMLADVVVNAHRIEVDPDHVPSTEGLARKPPFPLVALSHSVQVENNDATKGALTQCIDIVLGEIDEPDCVMVIPFFRNILQKHWMPGMYTATYNAVDETKDIAIELFWGFEQNGNMSTHVFRQPALSTLGFVRDTFALINCSNVSLQRNEPSNLRKMRARKKGIELNAYHTIKLPGSARSQREHQGGTHASPAMHHRRGHYRTLYGGTEKQRDVYVNPCVVGSIENGRVAHDYEV